MKNLRLQFGCAAWAELVMYKNPDRGVKRSTEMEDL